MHIFVEICIGSAYLKILPQQLLGLHLVDEPLRPTLDNVDIFMCVDGIEECVHIC